MAGRSLPGQAAHLERKLPGEVRGKSSIRKSFHPLFHQFL
jgi:hypothetical protein